MFLSQSADLKKVYDIFVDNSIELAVRKSAGEQLAVIINGNLLCYCYAGCHNL
jgi:hypothetical protein